MPTIGIDRCGRYGVEGAGSEGKDMLLDHEVGAHHEPVDIAEDHPQTEKLD
jgi:hypothetical protein